jgi:hypothetical protein
MSITVSSGSVVTTNQTDTGKGTAIVEADAYIIVAAGVGLDLASAGGTYAITVNGGIQATNGDGIELTGVGNLVSKLTVGADGHIFGGGAGNMGLDVDGAATIVNAGYIGGRDRGISINTSSSSAISITNKATGTIAAQDGGSVIIFGNGFAAKVNLTNDGIIQNRVSIFDTGAVTVKNTGLIGGNLALADGNDSVTNSGRIQGLVDLSAGKNSLSNTGEVTGAYFAGSSSSNTITNTGSIQSGIDFGTSTGTNKVTNSGTIGGTFAMGLAADTLDNAKGTISANVIMGNGLNTAKNSGTIGGLFEGGADKDTVTNSGLMQFAVSLGDGDNVLTNSGIIGSHLSTGGGNDTVKSTNEIQGSVDLGNGKNSFTNSGSVGTTVTTGAGDDSVTNSGTIGNTVTLGSGKNSFTNSGAISSSLMGGADNDTFKNTGSIGLSVNMGSGTNSFTNSGSVASDVISGTGDDTLTNSGTIGNSVLLGSGKNTFTNSGTAGAYVGGSGVDIVKNTGTINGVISLGTGDDVFTGGNFAETVLDDYGLDKISLGGGNDTYNLSGGLVGDDTDIVDGGTGSDTVDGSSISVTLLINLDTVAHDAVGANKAFVSLDSEDTVKGFENARGGNGADFIYGTSQANTLEGNGGADVLLGFAGNDVIEGGAGTDQITGGSGKDVLTGGAESDRFYYLALADSGPAVATRDVITDFMAGVDKIDMQNMDSDESQTGVQNTFFFFGMNADFTGQLGFVRAIHIGSSATGGYTLVQADTDGDQKADFAIELTGILTLTGVDFDF